MENIKGIYGIKDLAGKLLRLILIGTGAFIVSRNAFCYDGFPVAIALAAYCSYGSIRNLWVVLPIAFGVYSQSIAGINPWGSIITIVLSGAFFASARHVKLQLIHRALLAALIYIIITSIYAMTQTTIYLISMESLLLQGALVLVATYVCDYGSRIIDASASKWQALTVITIGAELMVNGVGASFLLWPVLIAVALIVTWHIGAGEAMLICAIGALVASLLGQTQWGYATTIIIALAIAGLTEKKIAGIIVFVVVCLVVARLDGEVVMGIDRYCLAIGLVIFAAVSWRMSSWIGQAINRITGGSTGALYDRLGQIATNMEQLATMYGTYVDGRAVLSSQFTMINEIIGSMRVACNQKREHQAKRELITAIAQRPARGEINGDSAMCEELEDGRTVLIISDGMGKGRKAGAESQTVTKTVVNLLRSGASVETTLQIINSIMAIKGSDDTFATVDLAIIDRCKSVACFYKIGGAPSLIRRGNSMLRINMTHVPLGTVNGIEIHYREVKLRRGDIIVMMSDGVSDVSIDVVEAIASKVRSCNPETMSQIILGEAWHQYSMEGRDDLTVIISKVV